MDSPRLARRIDQLRMLRDEGLIERDDFIRLVREAEIEEWDAWKPPTDVASDRREQLEALTSVAWEDADARAVLEDLCEELGHFLCPVCFTAILEARGDDGSGFNGTPREFRVTRKRGR
jgi:hypothetical protein